MNIYIKSLASSENNPANFSLSADAGSITPATISYSELTSGAVVSFSDSAATQITFSGQGFQPKTVTLNKDEESCFQTSAVNYVEGNARPTTPNGMLAPFRTSTVSASTVSNILDLNNGDQFSLQIFENIVNLTIFNKNTAGANEIIIEATGNNNDFFFLSKDISTNEIRFLYRSPLNTGSVKYSSTDSKIKEWAPSDFIIVC